jgi:hypothetical protein
MNENEKPALEKAVDKVNDVVEEIALKAADASIEPDPQHVAGTSNEQVYLPDAETGAAPVMATVPHSPTEKPGNKEKAKK